MQSNKFIINGTLSLEIVEKHGIVTAPDLHEKNKQTLNANCNLLSWCRLVFSGGYKFLSC